MKMSVFMEKERKRKQGKRDKLAFFFCHKAEASVKLSWRKTLFFLSFTCVVSLLFRLHASNSTDALLLCHVIFSSVFVLTFFVFLLLLILRYSVIVECKGFFTQAHLKKGKRLQCFPSCVKRRRKKKLTIEQHAQVSVFCTPLWGENTHTLSNNHHTTFKAHTRYTSLLQSTQRPIGKKKKKR